MSFPVALDSGNTTCISQTNDYNSYATGVWWRNAIGTGGSDFGHVKAMHSLRRDVGKSTRKLRNDMNPMLQLLRMCGIPLAALAYYEMLPDVVGRAQTANSRLGVIADLSVG